MYRKPKKHRALITALSLLMIVAMGLQSLTPSSGNDCVCVSPSPSEAIVFSDIASSVQTAGCCSKQKAKECCCNPSAIACQCSDCHCDVDDDSRNSWPALPISETTESVPLSMVSSAPIDFSRNQGVASRFSYRNAASRLPALSSQQTCILLSRFTC